MADTPTRFSPLNGFAVSGTFGRKFTGGPGIILCERPNLSIFQVAAYADTAEKTAEIIFQQLGVKPPTEPNRSATIGQTHVYWVGPYKWWIIKPDDGDSSEFIVNQLNNEAAVTAIGHGRSCIRINGPMARDLLSKGCTLDFHPGQFSVGTCAQTSLGHINALINCVDDEPTFDLFVFRSFAVSFWEWITDASAEFGYRVSDPINRGTPTHNNVNNSQ